MPGTFLNHLVRIRGGFVLILVLFAAAAAGAEPLNGVAEIVDGDAVRIAGRTVHLYGIDAPEMDQPCTDKKGKPYKCGHAAMRRLFLYVGADPLNCTIRQTVNDGSVLATCRVKSYFKHTENGATRGEMFDVALEMVLTGHALADRNQSPDYIEAEGRARMKRRGVWSGSFDPPSGWRSNR